MNTTFEPTLAAAHAALAAVRPADYARTRNALDGAVTRLSPYITHGMLTLPEVLAAVTAREPLDVQHMFVFELGWREYFQHVWWHRGDAILESLHPGRLPDEAYARALPADLLEARTGVPVIDQAVRTLYATGYLHNHARLWLASYVVHIRKLHWRAGAEWLYGHLLDGDIASNHLSWQWVAATGSSKPYLFNADNVARFAPAAWHSPGTVIDAPYEALERLARHASVPRQARGAADGVAVPALLHRPPAALCLSAPDAQAVRGRDVWLVHPWALGDVPADLPAGSVCVAAFIAEVHEEHAWAAARWQFVSARMAQIAALRWFGTASELATALSAARSVNTLASAHLGHHLTPLVGCRSAARLFPAVDGLCNSFSHWWARATREVKRLGDLPGLNTPGATAPPGRELSATPAHRRTP
jgi:deoxyribodipyrimidine photo-lyase